VQGINPFRVPKFVAVGMQMYKRYQIRNQEFVFAEACSIAYLDPRSGTFPLLLLSYPWSRQAEVSLLEPPHRLAAAFRSETSVKKKNKIKVTCHTHTGVSVQLRPPSDAAVSSTSRGISHLLCKVLNFTSALWEVGKSQKFDSLVITRVRKISTSEY